MSMTLLAPLGLLALLSLPVIIILHMLRERRRRVVVPSLLLWQLLPKRQEAERKRRLPLTLLLLLHLLAAALLALALAQPQWAIDLLGRDEHLAVIIDTSTSMAAPAPGIGAGSRLDAARGRAQDLVNALSGAGTITLIAAGPQVRLLDSAGSEGAPRLIAALATLEAGGTGSDLAAAITMAEASLRDKPDPRIVVLTDAAIPNLGDAVGRLAPTVPVSWEPVGAPLDNRAVVTLAARPRSPGGPTQVYARAVNYGATPLRTQLRLFGDEELLDTRTVTFQPNGEVELTWTLPGPVGLLRAELDAQDGLPIDDTASLSLSTARPLRALLVSASPAALERALRAIPGLSLEVIDPAAYPGSPLAERADLTVFEGYLPDAWPAGGVLAISPPAGGLLESDRRPRLPDEAALRFSPTANAALFDGISLGSVSFGPLETLAPPPWLSVQILRNEQPLILRGRSGASEVAVWAFDLSRGNLVGRLAFPLLVARTVRDLTPAPLPGSALLGQHLTLRPDPRADELTLIAPDGDTGTIPLVAGGSVAIDLSQAGGYRVIERRGGADLFTGTLAVNAGAPAESNLAPSPLPQPAPAPAGAPAAERSSEDQRPIWPWLAALALIVIVGEWMYVHGRRSEVRGQGSGVRG